MAGALSPRRYARLVRRRERRERGRVRAVEQAERFVAEHRVLWPGGCDARPPQPHGGVCVVCYPLPVSTGVPAPPPRG